MNVFSLPLFKEGFSLQKYLYYGLFMIDLFFFFFTFPFILLFLGNFFTLFFEQNQGVFDLLLQQYHYFHLVAETFHNAFGINIMMYSLVFKFFIEILGNTFQLFFDIEMEEILHKYVTHEIRQKLLKIVGVGSILFFIVILVFLFLTEFSGMKASILG